MSNVERLDKFRILTSKYLVQRCAMLAAKKGYKHFAMQQGKCFSMYKDNEFPLYGSSVDVTACDANGYGSYNYPVIYELANEGRCYLLTLSRGAWG